MTVRARGRPGRHPPAQPAGGGGAVRRTRGGARARPSPGHHRDAEDQQCVGAVQHAEDGESATEQGERDLQDRQAEDATPPPT